MIVKFIENVIISDEIEIDKGDVFEAVEEGDFLYIRMIDDRAVKAPKNEINGILEIIED